MSNGDELTFEDVLWHLVNDENGNNRAEAAQMLGNYVDDLSDEEYQRASTALNHALNDANPMVIMAAMTALGAYQRRARRVEVVTEDDVDIPIATTTCAVCGKPEALVDGATCEQANCPYRTA